MFITSSGSLLMGHAGWLDGWVFGWLDGWMDVWMVGWKGGWMSGWMTGCLVGDHSPEFGVSISKLCASNQYGY